MDLKVYYLFPFMLPATMNRHKLTLRLVEKVRKKVTEVVNRRKAVQKDQDFSTRVLIEEVDKRQELLVRIYRLNDEIKHTTQCIHRIEVLQLFGRNPRLNVFFESFSRLVNRDLTLVGNVDSYWISKTELQQFFDFLGLCGRKQPRPPLFGNTAQNGADAEIGRT